MSQRSPAHELTDDIASELLCSSCNGYVSCGPVTMHPDGGTICGRCSPSVSDGCLRNTLFEIAMGKFTFPCRYNQQGCNERVFFNKTVKHENHCLYRTYTCPSLPAGKCSEKVSTFDIYKHFKQNHPNLITKDGKIELNLEKHFQNNFVMIVDGFPIVIQYNFSENVLCLDVKYFPSENQPNVFYKTQITSVSDAGCSLQFKESQGRIYESCSVNPQKAMSFELSNYLPSLNNPLSIYVTVLPSVSYASSSYIKVVQNASDLLQAISCFKCNNYCIFSVYEGNSLNNNLKVTACEKCLGYIKNPVNKTIQDLIYPCYWRECTFMGNKNNILQHVEECLFQSYSCPMEWCQKGFFTWNNVLNHMSTHGTYCPNPENVVVKLFSDKVMCPVKKVYFTIAEKKVLLVICNISENGVWSLKFMCDEFDVNLYFEHDHCRIRTKTCLYSDSFSLESNSEEMPEIFPDCFKRCKRIEAIIRFEETDP